MYAEVKFPNQAMECLL